MKQRIANLDMIRLVAMFLMIICHASDPFNAGATYGTGQVDHNMFFWGSIWGSAVRSCVPLFVMLTGALCLVKEQPLQIFWRQRIGRVLWPFLIWSVLYNLFPFFIKILGQPEARVYDFFVWASNPSGELSVCLRRVLEIPYRFDNLVCHMWYVYTLIGLYLFIPVLGSWVRQATRRQLELVLLLWALSNFLPYLHEFVGQYLFGECEWNNFGLLYYFSGFTGYLLLGHYFVTYLSNAKPLKVLSFATVAFALGFIFSWRGFLHMTSQPNATAEQIELFWTYCSPNVALMTSAIFLSIRLVKISGRITKALQNFTLCGFGIYMIHYFFVGPTYKIVEALSLPTALRVPAAALLILALSWAVVALVKHFWRKSRWLLG